MNRREAMGAFKDSEFPEMPRVQAPLFGEHNAEALKAHLGYTTGQVSLLRDE